MSELNLFIYNNVFVCRNIITQFPGMAFSHTSGMKGVRSALFWLLYSIEWSFWQFTKLSCVCVCGCINELMSNTIRKLNQFDYLIDSFCLGVGLGWKLVGGRQIAAFGYVSMANIPRERKGNRKNYSCLNLMFQPLFNWIFPVFICKRSW